LAPARAIIRRRIAAAARKGQLFKRGKNVANTALETGQNVAAFEDVSGREDTNLG
jgi:hypothetical protein